MHRLIARGRLATFAALVWSCVALNGAAAQDLLPPVAPDVISRGDNEDVIVRATRVREPLRVDGRLDEEAYRSVTPIDGFIQTVPDEGKPSSERTEAWILFDDKFIYIAGKCYESVPPEQWTANELRRDGTQLRNNDVFGVLLDTFHDRRNGYHFYVNPLGGFADQMVTDEGNPNFDWNPVWEVRTGRFDGGWTAELAIPFKSLRYNSGERQEWGIQLRRAIRRKNEWTHLTFLPASTGGASSVFRISRAATLVGLDLPPASKNVELKPYAISRLTTDRLRIPAVSNDGDGDIGLDAKYGVTANLTADITINTDFAQVEVDEQQVNLTRFSLQLPEKRDFFLEGRGIFDFGRGGGVALGGNSGPDTGAPSLFYSRRIGLSSNRIIPIEFGSRLTGKVGKTSLGVMNLEAADEPVSRTPATNFTVTRIKRDILSRSSIGAMFTNRLRSTVVPGASSQGFGVDGSFAFLGDYLLGGYWARSQVEGRNTDNDSYQTRFDYAGDRYGVKLDFLKVGDNFNPEVGFVRRDNFKRSFGSLRFSPRPVNSKRVRKYTLEAILENLVNGAGHLESRQEGAKFNTEFQSSDAFSFEMNRQYELLVIPFPVSPGVNIASGGYNFTDVTTSYAFGQQRRASGTVSLRAGHFYDGDITAIGYSGGRVSLLQQWSVEPSVSVNRVTVTAGRFTTTVIRARTDYGFSPRMSLGGLLQYSSSDHTFGSNLRFRWEYHPGSELFVVYTDEHDTLKPTPDAVRNRAAVVKINRLFRF